MDNHPEKTRGSTPSDWEAKDLPAEHPRMAGVMDEFQPLGHPNAREETMPDDESTAMTPGYISYARPIGPGHAESTSVMKGTLVTMVGVVLLSWIPFFGPFAAGLVGGWVARGWRGGLLATILPGAIASILTWFWYEVLRLGARSFLDATLGITPPLWALIIQGAILWTLLGGVLGGYLHSLRDHETRESGRRVQVG